MLDKDTLWRGRAYGAPQYSPPYYPSPSKAVAPEATPQRSVPIQRGMNNRNSAPPFSALEQSQPFSGVGRTDSRYSGNSRFDDLMRERTLSRHQVSRSVVQSSLPPFSNATVSRDDLDRALNRQRQQELMSSLQQQIQVKRLQEEQEGRARQEAAQQRLKDLERQRAWEQNTKDRKREVAMNYRNILDGQSGAADKQLFEASAKKFYGVDEGPKEVSSEMREAANRFYGVDEGSASMDLSLGGSPGRSPSRLAKTVPKTVMSDPITGAVRNIPASRQRIQSLGNQRPVFVSGKINDAPPPHSVFAEQPNFGKKVPRKVFFNPLTGERRIVGEESMKDVRKSQDNPFSYHYADSAYFGRFQEDFVSR